MRHRFEQLLASLPEDLDGVYIASPENRLYYTGFHSSAGVLLITRAESVFFIDSRYIEAAQNRISGCKIVLQEKLMEQISDFCKREGIRRLAVEARRMVYADVEQFREKLEGVEIAADSRADDCIEKQRMVKSAQEIGCIRQAQGIAERAFEELLQNIRPGMTEREIALTLEYSMLSKGAQGISFETITVSGANSSMPHGVPTGKKVEDGDFITLDFGAVYQGYHSDMTRTVAVGKVSEKQRLVYQTVLAAQQSAIDIAAAGLACAAVDEAARSVISAAGYGDFFRHSTGHGVGIEIHEAPNLSLSSSVILEPGMVVTVEPGIYLPGEFGVRIEDMLLITADGAENLTKMPKELLVL